MNEAQRAHLALNGIPGIGSYSIKQLISYCGSAENVFKTPTHKLLKIPGIGPAIVESLKGAISFERAEEILLKAQDTETKLLFTTNSEYPKRLTHIPDTPTVLYYKGTADLNTKKIVAVVGTRKATAYGKGLTDELITGLAKHSPLVVSGLAYGIDAQAHRKALQVGLDTVGVMGTGIDLLYPSVHKKLANDMLNQGGLLTEYTFGTEAETHHFPTRNRIIAGMADAIIVVEAAAKGGALITAEVANDYNRDVFAVPGSLNQTYSVGCNNLIKRNRAHLLTKVEDIEYIMNWSTDKEQQAQITLNLEKLENQEREVAVQLQEHQDGIQLDQLSWSTNIPVNQLAGILLNLEIKGFVKSLPGKKFALSGY